MTSKETHPKKPVRCAIYCRVSSDDGLSQAFSSLDAQRDSGEAFVRSRAGMGWTCLPDRFDDGGFSGGNMDRPGLRRLLEKINAGGVDAVLVYKLDRFTRSIRDFGKLAEILENRNVTLVSVTQSIDTSTSSGRLMLHMLLSFAAFERELASERTRDKIALARQRGRWAGGRPLLGYNVADGCLVVNPAEAERVRAIFGLYLERASLNRTVDELNRRQWTGKSWLTRSGKPMGGRPFDKSLLQRLLTNQAYLGKVRHKDNLYNGQHAGIVDVSLFDQVQAMLKSNGAAGGALLHPPTPTPTPTPTSTPTSALHPPLLKGLLICGACGAPMTHSHTNKGNNRKYRYYVCRSAATRGWRTCPNKSVPAHEIEKVVIEQIVTAASRPDMITRVHDHLVRMADASPAASPVPRRTVAQMLTSFDRLWDELTSSERAEIARLLVQQVQYDVGRGEVEVTFHPGMFERPQAAPGQKTGVA